MTRFTFILAATDFSVPADHAVRRAAMLAQQHGARLGIVHVVNPTRFSRIRTSLAPSIELELRVAKGRERLRKLAAELRGSHDVAVDFELRTGDTLEQLQLASSRADLLVVGQRHRNPCIQRVPGTTTQRLVEICRRPVLVVKQVADVGYRRILVPIDLTPASATAAVVAEALAPGIDLQIFHAFAWSGEAAMREADVRESVIHHGRARREAGLVARMRFSTARLGVDSRRMSFAIGQGSPVVATLRQAQALGADVLVATKHRRMRVGASVLGCVNSLLLGARCDMLIVPGRMRDPRQTQASQQALPLSRGVESRGAAVAAGASALIGPWLTPAQTPAPAWRATQRSPPRHADAMGSGQQAWMKRNGCL